MMSYYIYSSIVYTKNKIMMCILYSLLQSYF